MTVNSSRTRELDIGKVCQRAANLAGLLGDTQTQTASQLSLCKDLLETIIDALQAEGLRARAVEFRNVTLVSGQSAYTLDTDVLDVVGDAMYIDPDQADVDAATGEVPIVMIGRDDWQLLSNKAASGRPTQVYIHRTSSPPEARFWPVPDDNTAGTVRFQIHRLAADSDDAAKTVDLERPFAQYLIWELAHQLALASSLNMGRAQYFGGIARQKLEMVKSFAAQRTPARLVLDHPTGWNR